MSTLPSPSIAALLSFVFPGAGQIYAGDTRRGLLWAIPMVLFVLGVLWVLFGGGSLIGLVSDDRTLVALLVLNLAFFFYHLAAMFDAYGLAQRERRLERVNMPDAAPVILAALVAFTLVLHGVPEVLGAWGNDRLNQLFGRHPNVIPSASFGPQPTRAPTPTPLPTPTTSAGGSPTPTLSPGSTPTPTERPREFPSVDASWAQDGRLDMLLIGADAGPGRTSLRTDTMILLSVEIRTGKAALFGFPRNMINVPLPPESVGAYPGGTFPEMLSALWRRAAEQPAAFCCEGLTDEERGWRAITGSIQEMAGVQIDAVFGVDLNGFVAVVDAVGGVWIDVPAPVYDENYPREDGSGRITIDIKAGCQFFEGWEALAYARSRHQDSDYQRMRRQQFVLQAVRRQFDPLAMAPRAPALLDIAQNNIFTTINRADIDELAEVASRVDADRLYQVRFGPRAVANLGGIGEIRTRVVNIFNEPEPEPQPKPSGRPASCPPR